MKKTFLLLVVVTLIANKSFAECVIPPSCDDMGYTQAVTDCTGDKFVKCPFDTSKVFCLNSESSGNSSTTAPSTPCVNGALVFADGTCSFYEEYETDDNPALGVYFNFVYESYGIYENFVGALWGGIERLIPKNAKLKCEEQGGKLFVTHDSDNRYHDRYEDFAVGGNAVSEFYREGVSDYKTNNIIFVSPKLDTGNYFRHFYDDEILNNTTTDGVKLFYCYKQL